MKIRNHKIVICGAGGFIGGHLVRDLVPSGAAEVRVVDIKALHEWDEVLALREAQVA